MSGEIWYSVGPRDVFPETFGPFLLGDPRVRSIFMKHHADLLEPELEKYRQEFRGLAKSDEDVLSLALFPQVAPKFIEKRDHQPEPVSDDAPAATMAFSPTVTPGKMVALAPIHAFLQIRTGFKIIPRRACGSAG